MTSQMLTPVLDDAGLGFFLDNDNPGQFGHNGADEGFQALLWMNPESGRARRSWRTRIMGSPSGDFLLRRVAKEYGWNYKDPGQGAFGADADRQAQGAEPPCGGTRNSEGSVEGTVEEGTLNRLGSFALYSGKTQDAITVFRRNVLEYPKSANAYNSLGEAYLKAGAEGVGLPKHERSLQLDPKDQNASDMIKKLKEMQ